MQNNSSPAYYSQNNKLPDIAKASEIPMTANKPSYAGTPRPAALLEDVAVVTQTLAKSFSSHIRVTKRITVAAER